ncbi:hypothetical protein FJ364_04985 [Candidatus Dependentiae bacterium]|nr:hypothetical protein [Candidatus Dependentiae bacterium]
MLKKIFFFICLATPIIQAKTLLLFQTFGSTHHTGRNVAGSTERGITIKLAEAIQDFLSEQEPALQTFIVNPAGNNKKNSLEMLNKINQAKKALVIQLTASHNHHAKPACNIFFRCYNPLTDQIKRPYAPLTPIPLEDVYLLYFNQSKKIAHAINTQLQSAQDFIDTSQPIGIPLAHVRGIKHPLIQIEIKISQEANLTELSAVIARSLKQIIA